VTWYGLGMNRRRLLATGAALALSAGCGWGRPRPLVPVEVARERIAEVTVGLRPHRPAGFRVELEALGGRPVVHHYGHGGAGMSLSWGTARLAAELCLLASAPPCAVAVIGAGVAGLTTARQLQRRGFQVTLYASALPPHTTSNRSLACWTPLSGLISSGPLAAGFDTQFHAAAAAASQELQQLARHKRYGISWLDTYTAWDEPPTEAPAGWLRDPLVATETALGPGEHPFPTPWATVRRTLRLEPGRYLQALVEDVRQAGGRFVSRTFAAPEEVLALPEPVLVNCAGLGALALFGDTTLVPLKGQLVRLQPQPEVAYGISAIRTPGTSFLHMAPRSDGVILGGTLAPGDWSLEPDEASLQSVLDAHQRFFAGMARS
jgi:D-amino-acid oxidase